MRHVSLWRNELQGLARPSRPRNGGGSPSPYQHLSASQWQQLEGRHGQRRRAAQARLNLVPCPIDHPSGPRPGPAASTAPDPAGSAGALRHFAVSNLSQ